MTNAVAVLEHENDRWRRAVLELRAIIAAMEGKLAAARAENAALRHELSQTVEELQIMQEELQAAHDELGQWAAAVLGAAAPPPPCLHSNMTAEASRQAEARLLREHLRADRKRVGTPLHVDG